MHRVFNCGIGMVIVSAADADAAIADPTAAGEQVWKIGTVRATREGEAQTVVVRRTCLQQMQKAARSRSGRLFSCRRARCA